MSLFACTEEIAALSTAVRVKPRKGWLRASSPWWRAGVPLNQLADHGMKMTGAKLDTEWDVHQFPPDLPLLEYPIVSGQGIGHPMQFSEPLVLTTNGQRLLGRLLLVLTYRNPDLSFCPLLVYLLALMLTFTDAAHAFSIAQAMIEASRNSMPGSLVKYLPLSELEFDVSSECIAALLPPSTKISVLQWRRLLSGEILAYIPLPIQIQLLASFFAEGIKILYRLAITILSNCTPHSSEPMLIASIREYCSRVPHHRLLSAVFSLRLRRADIAAAQSDLRSSIFARSRPRALAEIPHWPDLERIRTCSSVVSPQLWLWLWARVLHPRFHHGNPCVAFSNVRDGNSFATLTRLTSAIVPCVVVFMDSNRRVFGVFLERGLSRGWQVDIEAVAFSMGNDFSSWRAPPCPRVDQERMVFVSKLDIALTISVGTEMLISIDEDMGYGHTRGVLGHPALTATDVSGRFDLMRLEVIGGM